METRNFHPVQDSIFLDSLVTCYQDVFSDDPWNEWLKCTKCGNIFGKKSGLLLSDKCPCGGSLTLFWEVEAVKNDIFHEVTSNINCKIVTIESEVVGFCWGYPISSTELEKKLQLPGLANIIQEKFGEELVGYIDEVGVTPNLRLRGLGKELWTERVNILAQAGCRVIVARSRPDVKIFNWWLKTGYEIIQRYGGVDPRVVIARTVDLYNQRVINL